MTKICPIFREREIKKKKKKRLPIQSSTDYK